MLRHPAWVQDKKQVPDQITIVAASPLRNGKGSISSPIGKTGNGVDPSEEEVMAVSPIGGVNKESRMTGSGIDGGLQVDKVAGDVHEGEMVLSAKATANLPEDIRIELNKQAESGTIDTNAIRAALKIEEKPGFAAGSAGLPVVAPVVKKKDPAYNPITLNTSQFQTPSVTPAPSVSAPKAAPNPIASQGVVDQNIKRLDDIAGGTSQTQQKIADQSLRRYDTQATQGLALADTQTSALGNDVPESVKNSINAQSRSNMRSQRSDLIGSLAATAEQNAQGAAQSAASLGMTNSQNQIGNALTAAKALMDAGIGQNLQGIVQNFAAAGININPASLQTMANQQAFTQGMDLISKGVASGFDEATINASLVTNGIDPKLFGTSTNGGTGLSGVIGNLKTAANTIDATIKQINESTSMSPEQKAEAIAGVMDQYVPQSLKDGTATLVKDAQGNWSLKPVAGVSNQKSYTGPLDDASVSGVLNAGPTNPYYSDVVTQKGKQLLSKGDVATIKTYANDGNAGHKAIYQGIVDNAQIYVPKTAGAVSNNSQQLTNPPVQSSVINYNGQPMLVVGVNPKSFTVVSLTDGTQHTYNATGDGVQEAGVPNQSPDSGGEFDWSGLSDFVAPLIPNLISKLFK